MANMSTRKLQVEIDRLLKKVSEGTTDFDSIFQKVHEATNGSQKEKYEGELKKVIKKLQRYRDQIKSWTASNDIKNKGPLVDSRKIIEARMEQFKQYEKETKTKPYSKEALSRSQEVTEEDKSKEEIRSWIGKCLNELSAQIDSFEAELESMGSSTKKKKEPGRQEHLQRSVERHKFHVNKLELILRFFENEQLSSDLITDIRDSVDSYIENNQDPEFLEDEALYDQLGLQSLSDDFSDSSDDETSSKTSDSGDKSPKDMPLDAAAPKPALSPLQGPQLSPLLQPNKGKATPQLPTLAAAAAAAVAAQQQHVHTPSSPVHLPLAAPSQPLPTLPLMQTGAQPPVPHQRQPPQQAHPQGVKSPPLHPSSPGIRPSAPLSPPRTNAYPRVAAPDANGTSTRTTQNSQQHSSSTSMVSNTRGQSPQTVASPSPSLSPGFSPLISPSNAKGPASPAESPSSSPLLTATHPPLPSSLQMAPSPTLVPTNVSQPSQPTSHNQSQYPSQPPTISSTNQSSQPTQAGTQLYPPKGISGTSPSLPEQKELRREQSKQDGSVHSSQQGSQKQEDTSPEKASGAPEQGILSQPAMSGIGLSLMQAETNSREAQSNMESVSLEAQASSPQEPMGDLSISTLALLSQRGGYRDEQAFSQVQMGSPTNNPSLPKKVGTSQPAEARPDGIMPSRIDDDNLAMLEGSFHNIPESSDRHNRRELRDIPSWLPTQALRLFDNPAIFEKLDIDTLFFIFYFQQGTYQQYLAAQQLKKRSWRYHKKYLTWFQRHEEPKEITPEYEQGTYRYFDYESGWCQRKKTEFTFEYRYLEE